MPVAVTLLLAVVTFLTSGRSGDFQPISIKILAFISSYAALQFLRAMIASVAGLSRRKYGPPTSTAMASPICSGSTTAPATSRCG